MKCPIDGKRCYQHIVAGFPRRCRHKVVIGKCGDCSPATSHYNKILREKQSKEVNKK